MQVPNAECLNPKSREINQFRWSCVKVAFQENFCHLKREQEYTKNPFMHKSIKLSLRNFCKSFNSSRWLKPRVSAALLMNNFWYFSEAFIFSFMGKFGCLGLRAEGTWGLWVSIPGMPLKISALHKYQYSFIQTLTSPAAVSSSPPHPSLNDSCFDLISFRVNKTKPDYYTHRSPSNNAKLVLLAHSILQ